MPKVDRPDHVPADRVVDFDLYHPDGVERDFHRAWLRLHRRDMPGVVWTPRNGGHWMATRYETLKLAYDRPGPFSNRVIVVPKAAGEQLDIIPPTMDPPENRPFRALLNKGLAPGPINRLKPAMRDTARALIAGVSSQGRCDFAADFARKYPLQMFMRLVDLPIDDVALIRRLADAIIRPDGTLSIDEAMRRFRAYLAPLVEARKGGDGDDILSHIVNGMIGDRAITDEEAVKMISAVLTAGMNTVASSLAFIFAFLAGNPDHRRRLADDPERISSAIDELFRRFPIVTLGRVMTEDVEMDGIVLKRGDMIMLPTPLAGLDDRVHRDPLTVDFDRTNLEHFTFGAGAHKCPGAFFARTEMIVAIEEWLAAIPDFQLTPGEAVRYKGGISGSIDRLELSWEPA